MQPAYVGAAGNGACQAAAHNISGDGAAIDVNMRVSSNGGIGICEDAAHDLMVEGAGVDHNVHIPLDIRGIGADHRGGITAGEGAEGGVFRREFQINVSGDAGGVHGTEEIGRASCRERV